MKEEKIVKINGKEYHRTTLAYMRNGEAVKTTVFTDEPYWVDEAINCCAQIKAEKMASETLEKLITKKVRSFLTNF